MHRLFLALAALAALTALTVSSGCSTSPSDHDTPESEFGLAAAVVESMRVEQPALEYFLGRARAVLVFPRISRASLVVGVAGGDGVLLENTAGSWSAPRFMSAGGVSFGVQAGAESGSVVVVIMNQRLLTLLQNKGLIDFGADVGLTMGPADAKAAATLQTFQDAYVFRDAGGLHAGIALDTAVVRDDVSRNAAYRGGPPVQAAEDRLRQSVTVAPPPSEPAR